MASHAPGSSARQEPTALSQQLSPELHSMQIARGRLRDEWKQHFASASLPFIVHVLVVSSVTQHPTNFDLTSVSRIPVGKHRLIGQPSDWYFVVVFYSHHGFISRSFHFISHAMVQHLNSHSSASEQSWCIPLALCQPESIIRAPPVFDLYQSAHTTQSLMRVANLEIIRASLETRYKLFTWMECSSNFKADHPLADFELQYAAIGDATHLHKLDSIVYHLLVQALVHVPSAKPRWLKGEQRLMEMKLMLRPELHTEICRITGCSPVSLESAKAAIGRLHALNIHTLSQQASAAHTPLSPSMQLAIAFHHRMLRCDQLAIEDKIAREKVMLQKSQDRKRRRFFRLDKGEPIPMIDIEQCAPSCMQELGNAACGTVEQQASLPIHKRRVYAQYLLELGYEQPQVAQMLRPKVMIEYEMRKPKEAWFDIQNTVRQADLKRKSNIDERDIKFQRCSDIMNESLCPHLSPAPFNEGQLLSIEAKSRARSSRFFRAKYECHSQLMRQWQHREGARLNVGKEVPLLSKHTSSPADFTRVVVGGAAAYPK